MRARERVILTLYLALYSSRWLYLALHTSSIWLSIALSGSHPGWYNFQLPQHPY